MAESKHLPTIWRLPDEVWAEIKPLLPPEKPAGTPGRPAVPFRKVLDGILYVLRTGCQWKAVPKEFGSGSTCHQRFQEWERTGSWRNRFRKLLIRWEKKAQNYLALVHLACCLIVYRLIVLG